MLGTVLLAVMAILVGLSIASSVSMSVLERSRELGPLRSVGFTARRLLGLLVRETLLLAGFAGAGGLMAGSLLALLLSSLGIRFRLPGLASGMLLRIAVTPEVLPVVPQLRAEPRPDAFGSLRALPDVGSIHNEGRLPPESPAFFLAPCPPEWG